jgi:dTDP-4-dehydrorhamnose reductase
MDATRILLIGKIGQVGWELRRTLAPLGQLTCVDYPEINLLEGSSIQKWVRETAPAVIVNAAAYTAVDKAESETELAMKINGVAPGILAEEAKRSGALLIHYSTDYVFDGTKTSPYLEDDPANPLGPTAAPNSPATRPFSRWIATTSFSDSAGFTARAVRISCSR